MKIWKRAVKVKVYKDPKSEARLGPVATALLSTLPKAALIGTAVLAGAGCTITKWENGTTKFTHITPIFVKRDVQSLDLVQGKLGSLRGEIDPHTLAIISAVTEAATSAALKSTKP